MLSLDTSLDKGIKFFKSQYQSWLRDWIFKSLDTSLDKGIKFFKSQYQSWLRDWIF